MNWLFLIVLALLAVYMYIGWKKGMILIIMSFVTLICSVIVTSVVAPQLNKYITDNTPIYETIRENTYNTLKKNGSIADAVSSAGQQTGIADAPSATIGQIGGTIDDIVEKVAEQLPLPEALREKMSSIKLGEAMSEGVVSASSKLEDVMTDFVSTYIAGMICSAGCYIVVFAILYIILGILFRLANKISKLPLINELNKGLGVLFGLIKGVLVVWIFFIAVTVLYNTEFAQAAMACVNDNAFLGWLFDNNLIMNILISSIMK